MIQDLNNNFYISCSRNWLSTNPTIDSTYVPLRYDLKQVLYYLGMRQT